MAKRATVADVRATVRDHRSGRGKVTGEPTHLPTPPGAAQRVAEDELVAFRAARDFAELKQAEYEHAVAARNLKGRRLLQRYGVPPTHEIDLTTGEIRPKRGA